ncbi:MAG: delta-60 repeat domain-containing protein [Bdellovibrionaceae bacterium]|nr:delta-60 repeat domain-containing protein [Pseudobdellovibrionaceae bacterium]
MRYCSSCRLFTFFFITLLAACTNGRFQAAGGGGSGSTPGYAAAGFPNDEVYAVAINSANGDVYIGGKFTSVGSFDALHIARYNSRGEFDTAFTKGTGFDNNVQTLLLTNDELYVGGDFNDYNGQGGQGLVRLTLNGDLDTAFNPPEDDFNAAVLKIRPTDTPPNQLFICGSFTSFGTQNTPRLTRLYTQGGIDTSFVLVGAGFSNTVRDVLQMSFGAKSVVAVGDFITANAAIAERILMMTTGGATETSFTPANGLNNQGYAIAPLGTDSFLVVGNFTTFNGTPSARVIGITTDATVSPAVSNGFNNRIWDVRRDLSNRYTVVGEFTTFSTLDPLRVAQFDSGGAPLGAFLTSGGFDDDTISVAIQPNGMPLIGGKFVAYQGTSAQYIARLTTNGVLDTSFPMLP